MEQNLNDTATFNIEMDDPNVSMGDNIFQHVNIEEKKCECPICEKKIIDSNVSSHFKGFHNPNFYEQILIKINEKKNLLNKCLQDIANLKLLFENNWKNSSLKPKKNVVIAYKDLMKNFK